MKEQFNYIDKDGKLETGDRLYDMIYDIRDGNKGVELDYKYNIFVGKEGKLLSEDWFDDYRIDNGNIKIKLNDEWKYLDKNK